MSALLSDPTTAIVVHLLVTGAAVLLVGKVMPGIRVDGYGAAVVFAALVALVNALAWSQLGVIRGVPQAVSSGLGSLALSTLVFYVVGRVAPGVQVSGCLTAGLGALAVSFVNGLIYTGLREALRLR